ncbi:MAG: DUF4867 family protein [Eubacteriales bacterium]|nr:DUF4867 family protein [Eubacteriales bacterium]
MSQLQTLREKNPTLPIYSAFDPEFKPYGRVVDFDSVILAETCKKAVFMPKTGTLYETDLPELEALPDFERVRRTLRGEGNCQAGCCWGHNTMLNALEYHRASEHNIAVTDMLVLLASQLDIEGLELPAGKVKGFFVPEGTTVEFYATTLHYAPCQTDDNGFICIIVLPRGTNYPLDGPRPAGYDSRLLWAKDKWLIAHPENQADVDAGAYPGLHGENYEVKY